MPENEEVFVMTEWGCLSSTLEEYGIDVSHITGTIGKHLIEDFAKWVAIEVIDEELWTYNYLAFAELACRKLVQLGIMQESDGEYTYEVVEDGNNDN